MVNFVTIPAQGAGSLIPDIAVKDKSSVLYQRVAAENCATAVNTGSQVTVDTGAGGDVILASNASRAGFSFTPNGDIYVSFGGTPDNTSYLLPAYTPFNMMAGVVYTGVITGLAVTGSVTVYVVEF